MRRGICEEGCTEGVKNLSNSHGNCLSNRFKAKTRDFGSSVRVHICILIYSLQFTFEFDGYYEAEQWTHGPAREGEPEAGED